MDSPPATGRTFRSAPISNIPERVPTSRLSPVENSAKTTASMAVWRTTRAPYRLQTGHGDGDGHQEHTFDSRVGLEGTVNTIARHRGELWIGASSGL